MYQSKIQSKYLGWAPQEDTIKLEFKTLVVKGL